MKFFVIFVIFMSANCKSAFAANATDEKLRQYIKRFRFEALQPMANKNANLYQLGEKLFFDNILSGNDNISCSTCHHPDFASADALPLSLGEGATGLGKERTANNPNQIIARNSPDLFNKGHKDVTRLFWDGRVSYDPDTKEYETPEEALNGPTPEREDITSVLDGALAAQALFPLLSHEEMRGREGDNLIADAQTNLEAWSLITKKVLANNSYKELFEKTYQKDVDFNIGHIGRALSEFIRYRFQVTQTPWDQYIHGNDDAMTEKEKKGALVFIERGRCILCHNGAHLSNETFQNIASPQIGPGKDIFNNDEGRFLVTGRTRDKYMFKVPPLRNVAKTAPYFHSGTYTTLEQVIDHYEKGVNALDDYDQMIINNLYRKNYVENLFVETNQYRLFKKKEGAHPVMQARAIRLNLDEREELLQFLKTGLTEN